MGLIVLGYLCGGQQIIHSLYGEDYQLTPGTVGTNRGYSSGGGVLATGSELVVYGSVLLDSPEAPALFGP